MLEGRARTLSGPSPDLTQPVLFASAVIYGQVVIVLAGLITDVGPASRLARVAESGSELGLVVHLSCPVFSLAGRPRVGRLGFVLGFPGDPRRIAGAFLLFGFDVSRDAFARLLDLPDPSVDPLADVGLISGLCVNFRLALVGRFGRSCPRLLFRAGSGKGSVPPKLLDDLARLGIWCPGGRRCLGRPGLACVDGCLALSFEGPLGCLGVGVELPPPAG
jgi:hypothetical protein